MCRTLITLTCNLLPAEIIRLFLPWRGVFSEPPLGAEHCWCYKWRELMNCRNQQAVCAPAVWQTSSTFPICQADVMNVSQWRWLIKKPGGSWTLLLEVWLIKKSSRWKSPLEAILCDETQRGSEEPLLPNLTLHTERETPSHCLFTSFTSTCFTFLYFTC